MQLPNTGILVALLEFLWHLHTACTIYPMKLTYMYIYIYIYSTCIHECTCAYTCMCIYAHTHASLVYSLSCVLLCPTPWTVAHQASPSMGFSRQESWNGLPFPSPIHKHIVETIYVIIGLICELFFKCTYNSQLNFWGWQFNSVIVHFIQVNSFVKSPQRVHLRSVQWLLSHTWLFATSCAICSTPGSSELHCLLEFAQIHVHWVSDAIQPSHALSAPSPFALNLSQHQGHCVCAKSPQ